MHRAVRMMVRLAAPSQPPGGLDWSTGGGVREDVPPTLCHRAVPQALAAAGLRARLREDSAGIWGPRGELEHGTRYRVWWRPCPNMGSRKNYGW